MKHEDDLMDALLKQQGRGADEELLASIEKAMDEEKAGGGGRHRWIPLSAAAALAVGGVFVYQNRPKPEPELAYHEAVPAVEPWGGNAVEAPSLEGVRLLQEEGPEVGRVVSQETRAAGSSHSALPSVIEAPAAPMSGMFSDEIDEGRADVPFELGRVMEMTDSISDQPRTPRPRIVVPPRERDQWKAPAALGTEMRLERQIVARQPFFDAVKAGESLSRDRFDQLTDQPWKSPWENPLSTFSIDVDTASYTNIRRAILEGRPVQPDAVRIEECINYFDYRYEPPSEGNAFAAHTKLATCPWQPQHLLARVAIKGREIAANARPASNLVFLIDVSGSMQLSDKLPLLKQSMQVLIDSLDERDRVGMVVYAGTEGVVLEPTLLDEAGKLKAAAALAKLESGGSTNGGAGLSRAYRMALANKVEGGVNRVILATDGDFNVGTTGQGQLVEMVKAEAAKGVSLSVLGFGTGNLNDSMMEAITNDGNGNYFYVDGQREAERIFLQKLSGTLVTIAKDVKIQVEFNPGKVKAYRLIGYANRVLRNQDFNDDKVDAGDIGAGHTVTVFYEIVPVGVAGPDTGEVDGLRYQQPADRKELVESDDWFTLKLRYKHPEGEVSQLVEAPVTGEAVKWEDAGNDFRMASAVALFGMKLRNLPEAADVSWERVAEIARPALADDPEERRAEFVEMIKKLE